MYNESDHVAEEQALPERKSVREGRVKLLVVRLTPEERREIDEVAQAEGLTASSWVRRLVKTTLARRERRAAAEEP